MTSYEKYQTAIRLLQEINCPEQLMAALWLFGMAVQADDRKMRNWQALAEGRLITAETEKEELKL